MIYYDWHPIYKHVKEVVRLYNLYITSIFYRTIIDKKEYEKLINSYDFNFMLDLLRKESDEDRYKIFNINNLKEELKVFDPLIITTYQQFALFKYGKYESLSREDLLQEDFWNLYDGLYRECRSVVFDISTLQIVLAPQAKFFNLNEMPETSLSVIQDKIKNASIVEITEKMDGSNQNYTWYKNRIIGSGSQALDPEKSWRLKKGYEFLTENDKSMIKKYPNYTFMYEFISVENQILVEYKQEEEGLYLFGIRNNINGNSLSYAEVQEISKEYHVKMVETYKQTFSDVLSKIDDYKCNEKEGWVINIIDKNKHFVKIKLKVNDYKEIHKVLSRLISPNVIIKYISENRFDDLYSKIPCQYRENAVSIAKTVWDYIDKMRKLVYNYMSEAYVALGDNYHDVKSFALWCNNNVPKSYRGYIMNEYKGYPNNYLKKCSQGYKKLHELKIKE